MNATPTLDGMPSAAEMALAAMRAMFKKDAPRFSPGEALWIVLTDSERRFLLRAAKLDAELAASAWRDLPDVVHADVVAAWGRLADWVHRVERQREKARR